MIVKIFILISFSYLLAQPNELTVQEIISAMDENDVSAQELETALLKDNEGNLKVENSGEKLESITVKQARGIS